VFESAGRWARLQRLFRGGYGEAIAKLPIPGNVESESSQVCADGCSDDR
jgi:hypothetical protein